MWVVAMLIAHQLAVPVVRPLARREPLPLVRVMALMPSAARIVAPMAPALPTAGLCPIRWWPLGAA
jgi:hypothetical protein